METGTTDVKTDQDDWKVAFEHVATFDVPRFIRLFVINRIITAYLNPRNVSTRNKVKDALQLLVAGLKNEQNRKIAYKILSLLIQNGIKKYMEKCYNEKEQSRVIELIFENIIIIKFGKEYQQFTTYYYNDDNYNDNVKYYYQCKVFNNDDLMCLIFRYLTFTNAFIGELHGCSLVNSCWLYHVWNTKLIFGKYSLNYFIYATMKLGGDEDVNNSNNSVTRSWERLVKLKSITFHSLDKSLDENGLLLSRLSMLNHVEEIHVSFDKTNIRLLKVLVKQCSEKINKFHVSIVDADSSIKYPVLSPLYLPNAKIIHMETLYFYITWTKKCKELAIPRKIDENWCQHVIDNCDCSGIKHLTIYGFGVNIPDSDSNKSILQQFSKKFVNLKRLNIEMSISGTTLSTLSWMELFAMVLKENDGNIHVKTTADIKEDDFVSMNESVENWVHLNGIAENPITRLTFDANFTEESCPTDQYAIKLIKLCRKNLRWLTVDFDEDNTEGRGSNVIKCITSCLSKSDNDSKNDNSSFKSIKVIDVKLLSTFKNLIIVNEMFATDKLMNIFSENKIFLKVIEVHLYKNSELDFSNKESSITKFKQLCSIIKSILTKQIAADIGMGFETSENRERKIYDKIYNSYFGDNDNSNDDRKAMGQYKQAKCNQYCIALKYPILSLIWRDDSVELYFTSAQLKNEATWY